MVSNMAACGFFFEKIPNCSKFLGNIPNLFDIITNAIIGNNHQNCVWYCYPLCYVTNFPALFLAIFPPLC